MSGSLFVASVFLVAINLLTISRFRTDKRLAIAGRRRIAESDLLWLALLGGSPGALIARSLFRHKTRKEPFSTFLQVIFVSQIGAVIGLSIVSA